MMSDWLLGVHNLITFESLSSGIDEKLLSQFFVDILMLESNSVTLADCKHQALEALMLVFRMELPDQVEMLCKNEVVKYLQKLPDIVKGDHVFIELCTSIMNIKTSVLTASRNELISAISRASFPLHFAQILHSSPNNDLQRLDVVLEFFSSYLKRLVVMPGS